MQPTATSSSVLAQQAGANAAQIVSNPEPPTMGQFIALSESVTQLTQRVTTLEQQVAALLKHTHPTTEADVGGYFSMPNIRAYCQGQPHDIFGVADGTAPPDFDSFNVRLMSDTAPPTVPGSTGLPVLPAAGE
jgi:hypothetical protein